MRVFLISANTEPFPEPVFPIGAVYVANTLQKAGAQARIFDIRHSGTYAYLRKELELFRPDGIGISLTKHRKCGIPCNGDGTNCRR